MGGDSKRRTRKELDVQSSLSVVALQAGMSTCQGLERGTKGLCDHFELIFVLEGTLPIREEEQEFEVRVGQSLLLWPGWWSWSTAHHSPDLCFLWLHFRVKRGSPIEQSVNGEQALCVPQYTTVSRPNCLEYLFRRYLDDQESGRPFPAFANVLAWLMLGEVADPRPEFDTKRSGADVACRALTYIHAHCHQPLTASKIADQLGYNPEYLNRVFHQAYHRTLTEEIHQARMAKARRLLLNSGMCASEIGRACGFTDIKYFFRLFRRYEGNTPTAFRRLHAQGQNRSE
jgi:AraC-like DNA-binding protein